MTGGAVLFLAWQRHPAATAGAKAAVFGFTPLTPMAGKVDLGASGRIRCSDSQTVTEL